MNIVGQEHNELIMWLYENHHDSCTYYHTDHPEFYDFVHRKTEAYFNRELSDLTSDLLENDKFIITLESVEEYECIEEYSDWTQAEYDSLEIVYDKVIQAYFNDPVDIEEILLQLELGIEKIDAEDFPNEEDIIDGLILWGYSLQLVAYIAEEEEYPDEHMSCLLYTAIVDYMAATRYCSSGEFAQSNQEDYEFCVIGSSALALYTCFGGQ